MTAKRKPTPAARAKVKKVMEEWEKGTLHSGSKKGPIVRSQKQAVAIALSQSGQSRKPPPKPGPMPGKKRKRK